MSLYETVRNCIRLVCRDSVSQPRCEAITMREVLAALAAAALAGCGSTQTAARSLAVPTDAQRSTIPGIYLPAGADRDPSDTVPGENERWEYAADYLEAVRQEQQLLPVGRSLDGYPWCETTRLPSAV